MTKLVQAGGGRHIVCLPPGQIYPVLKWSTLAQICNVIGIGFVKISVCLCVLRIIDRARQRLSQFLWILIAFVATSHFVQMLIFLIQCRPMQAIWDPNVKGTCFSPHVTYTAGYTNYGLDAATDLICAGIPIFVIHQLQMNIRNKVALGFLMSLGVSYVRCPKTKGKRMELLTLKQYCWLCDCESSDSPRPVWERLHVEHCQSWRTDHHRTLRGNHHRFHARFKTTILESA